MSVGDVVWGEAGDGGDCLTSAQCDMDGGESRVNEQRLINSQTVCEFRAAASISSHIISHIGARIANFLTYFRFKDSSLQLIHSYT